jgi:hypothetical protein
MKIHDKILVEAYPHLSGAALDEGKRDELATPRLLARSEHAGKFMRTAESERKPSEPSGQAKLGCFSRQALLSQIKAGFPGPEVRAGKQLKDNQLSSAHCATLIFDEEPSDQRIAYQHERNFAMYFTNTWPSRLRSSQQQQFAQGDYVLMHPNGETVSCTTYRELAEFVTNSAVPDMPERLLHLAGPQLSNFLCQTFLYNPALCLFGYAGQHRVEPLPNLRTTFEVARNQDGEIRVRYTAGDNNVHRTILVGPRGNDEYEAELLAPASIHFSGTLLFALDGACAVGPVQVRATAIKL